MYPTPVDTVLNANRCPLEATYCSVVTLQSPRIWVNKCRSCFGLACTGTPSCDLQRHSLSVLNLAALPSSTELLALVCSKGERDTSQNRAKKKKPSSSSELWVFRHVFVEILVTQIQTLSLSTRCKDGCCGNESGGNHSLKFVFGAPGLQKAPCCRGEPASPQNYNERFGRTEPTPIFLRSPLKLYQRRAY